jgi:2-polyprenyl-3-methyl-5-hydroxy-6-metoxy-1,4-benzoquinol methylase
MPASTPASCSRCEGASEVAFIASDRNRAVTAQRFTYRCCIRCGVTWLPEVPEDLATHYPPGYHDFLVGGELAVAAAAQEPRIEMLLRHVTPGRMVEVGPSQGLFSFAARRAGFGVTALEMDEACCRHLEHEVGVHAVQTANPAELLERLPPSRAVVMWHVIEHLPDPWTVLRASTANLEPGGVLALATPNPQSLQARVLGRRWVHLDAPRHLTLIPLDALRDEADKLGLSALEATTSDPVGLQLNRMGWERSLVCAPTLRDRPLGGYTAGRLLTPLFAPVEQRGLRGAAYTVILRKD